MAAKGTAAKSASGASMSKYDVEVEKISSTRSSSRRTQVTYTLWW